jgi:hypothetical protein
MSDLSWLRQRIWIALALPLTTACNRSNDRRPSPQPEIADSGITVTTDATVAAVPVDAAPAPAEWLVDHPPVKGCQSETWCGPPELAAAWAVGTDRRRGCPAAIDVPPRGTPDRPRGSAEGELALTERGGGAAACCYVWHDPGPCKGRPLIDDGRPVVAAIEAASGCPAGAAWLAAALDEHASVAAFARSTLELLAVAAPPALIAACQAASLDEIAHAQACFAMAARHGAAAEPGPLPALSPRGGGLPQVACDTFVEGCVGETIGAAMAAEARDRAEDPDERAVLAQIATDEARHAALAWQTVAWALGGGDDVAAALRRAASGARAAAVGGVAAAAWRDIIDPTLARLLDG